MTIFCTLRHVIVALLYTTCGADRLQVRVIPSETEKLPFRLFIKNNVAVSRVIVQEVTVNLDGILLFPSSAAWRYFTAVR